MVWPMLSLSQAHLTLLETCPRRFQYIFDQALAVPPKPTGQEAALWGSQFHLLMQQQALGIPIDVMATASGDMTAKVNALRQQAPHLFEAGPHERLRQSEHQRTLAFNGYLFTVIYDLVILSADAGLIVDWKTYLKPPLKQSLANDWQTRLYLYVLAETSHLAPDQLTMAYWFVRHQDQQGNDLPPSDYRFAYSLQQHEQTRADLMRLTDQLSCLRQRSEFPQTANLDRCERCPFQLRCQRLERPDLSIDLDAIEEISLP
ncbi:PD-(D/E)XK nuclease family protein [Leptolyngbya cf. ectocarpi LEGE 11479]|uniref:PD-(D/E)XK nuclease family protein n=1 Tax=Leptolyngbya cf. ectocarpi LEGE 11479 TaxID=1828722 RepID=A0A928X2J3_LEPEC|nr:PD-(D/E)XK nuclease family protein [Leptolyngbya ectocarpi]MBE9065883.1 PD-(D/E)XK nuclease family protein [Leptolyngbya cf. ectocarpi LEGE 11479]